VIPFYLLDIWYLSIPLFAGCGLVNFREPNKSIIKFPKNMEISQNLNLAVHIPIAIVTLPLLFTYIIFYGQYYGRDYTGNSDGYFFDGMAVKDFDMIFLIWLGVFPLLNVFKLFAFNRRPLAGF
jgi:hypothetical protein